MQLFYFKGLNDDSTTFSFDREESRHIIKVLRKQENDLLFVTNGEGTVYTTKIVLPSDNKCTVDIISKEKMPAPGYRLHLAVAPTKMNERYEWFLEKATEIGIDSITPILCEHSERKIVKSDRFDKIILAAMKQSNTLFLPVLHEPITYKEFIGRTYNGQKFIAHCAETDKSMFSSALQTGTDITMLIGPEGDFSEKEIALAITNNFLPVSLGNTRLRTETAAIVACHTVVLLNERK